MQLPVEKPGDGANVQVKEPWFAAAPPQLAHRKDEGVERDHHQRDQRQREQDFQQRERGRGGTPGTTHGLADSGHHFGVIPWIFAMRVLTSASSFVRAVGSDQVGRRIMKFSVTVS